MTLKNTLNAAIALIALNAFGASAALADAPISGSETRVKQVTFADLDLATPEGIRAAHERVHEIARRMCSQLSDMNDLSKQPNFVKCVDKTMAAALPKVEQLAKLNSKVVLAEK